MPVVPPSGESRTPCEVPREEHASKCYVNAMDIDAEDNIYVTITFQESEIFKLFIFDKNGHKKLESQLPFLQGSSARVRMAVNKNGKIAILNRKTKILYIGNVCIELNSFEVDKSLFLNEFGISLYPHSVKCECAVLRFDWNKTDRCRRIYCL